MTGPNPPAASKREIELDFFRGLAMVFILISHTQANPLSIWLPTAFGPSDAADWFVFCSGIASALAFGGLFAKSGPIRGTTRILQRVWQLYWVHLCLFLAVALTVAAGSVLLAPKDYIAELNLHPFFEETPRALIGLMTLTYVPNYFDILPMYMLVLALVPAMMLAARVHLALVPVLVLGLWVLAQTGTVSFPAEWWSDRPWFFNPFAWQMVFFIAFALGMRWISPPPVNRWTLGVAAAVVLLLIPMSWFPVWSHAPVFDALRLELGWATDKTHYGLLRLVHFLSLAFLLYAWTRKPASKARMQAPWARPVVVIGQQSLASFTVAMVLSWVLTMTFDQTGRGLSAAILVNMAGIGLLIASAYIVTFFKSKPWKAAAPRPAAAAARPERGDARSALPHMHLTGR